MFKKIIRNIAATAVPMVAAVSLFAGVANAASGSWTLSGGGYSRQTTSLSNRNWDMGFATTAVTYRVAVSDVRSDGLTACTTVYVDKSNDGQGWINPLRVCDPDGYGGASGVTWYTAKIATAWQSCKLKIVQTAGSYSDTRYTDC